ncbi:uncharacterized protein LOC108206771 isoform X2 [Daucus carota subsp. sativus]|uniref:uncharacterized protein LOC108206771 isoform X2 n=1 Tax=Daucus carota subsp. sativus TaxID=79200 RepID=UPI0007EF99C1|nr:PREDICTED: uncharacterized protein LOC108206771 isoform X2 [Daucus carota subsp. sativus]
MELRKKRVVLSCSTSHIRQITTSLYIFLSSSSFFYSLLSYFATCAYEAGTSTSKKSRKKKTFTELREEESYLMNERVHLEKELASVNVTLNEQRYRGDNLKRIKLDFHVPSTSEMPAIRDEPMRTMFFQYQQSKASSDNQNSLILPRQEIDNFPDFSSSCKLPEENKSRERCFILPDLNMAPAEDPGCGSLF